MNEEIKLLFQYNNESGQVQDKAFKNPMQILTATTIGEIRPLFHKIEHYLNGGYYVAGYLSYEAAPAFDPAYRVKRTSMPIAWFGVFDGESEIDERALDTYEVSDWKLQGDYKQYQRGIQQIKAGIERGDTYQVNYTTRLEADFHGDAFSFYKRLARNQQSSYSAYLKLGPYSLLSASPELFFRIDGDVVNSKPMKGTVARGRYYEEDQKRIESLKKSEKEQAENLMIVDLLRNDLGKISRPGTVKVPRLFDVETYPTVHQMTSTVQGTLPKQWTMWEVFEALFPCGSITGAPKIRTMEYIEKLESTPRDVYCGAIGYMTPNREAVFNVPIRTVIIDHSTDKAIYGAGGGVTWDSTSKGEYEEIHTKARLLTSNRPVFDLLETMRIENGYFPLLAYHLDRLQKSSVYFGRPCHVDQVREVLIKIAEKHPNGMFKVRLLLSQEGEIKTDVAPLPETPAGICCTLARTPVDSGDYFLYHKTTYRDVYEQHVDPNAFSVLLWNEREELTEFTIGNLVVKKEGRFFTPPVESGLLAGTFRQTLLEKGIVEEKVLYKQEIGTFEEIWMINGLRGWMKVSGGLVE